MESKEEKVNMTCAEFQKVLPFIVDTGGTPEQERHLASCPVCRDLVADLRYIAEVAKLLVPMHEPPTRVWDGVREAINTEDTTPGRARDRLLSRSRSNVVT